MSGLRRICAVVFLIVAASTLKGQSVSGSTTVDIDPDTGMVTATCETDVDWASQGYQPMVGCLLQDGDGNYMASGQEQDFNGTVSAVVVLQIQGVPGTNYTATAQHLALLSVPTDEPDGACGACEIDEYNFQEISNEFYNGGIPYSYPVYFYGPGPEGETPAHAIPIANTTNSIVFPKATISLKFIGNKSDQDQLHFLGVDPHDCEDTLGGKTCANYWLWNLEGTVTVNDDASLWTLTQTASLIQKSGNMIDSNGNLHPFSYSIGGGQDSPDAPAIQQQSGTKTIFWIDAPGSSYLGPDGNPIYNLSRVQNFSVKVCSTWLTIACATQSWYVQLIVGPGGGLLDPSSTAAYGSSN